MKRRARRAFTLTELMVVIAIIAILAGILFPVFAQAREQARATGCLSNSKRIGTAVLMYAQDFDEATAPWLAGTECARQAQPERLWSGELQAYVKEGGALRPDGVFQCPFSNGAHGLHFGSWLVDPSSAGGVDYGYAAGDPITSRGPRWLLAQEQPSELIKPLLFDCKVDQKPRIEGASAVWCRQCVKSKNPSDSGWLVERCTDLVYDCLWCTCKTTGRSRAYLLCAGKGDIKVHCPLHYLGEEVAEYRRDVMFAPRNASNRLALADGLLEAGQFAAAARELRTATRLDPKSPRARHALGDLLFEKGEYTRAVVQYQSSVELWQERMESTAAARNSLGRALYRLGRKAEARTEWQRVVESSSDPTDVGVWAAKDLLAKYP